MRGKIKNFTFYIAILTFTFYILHFNSYALDEIGEELKLYLGEVKVISVSSPQRIAIGNPNIADVVNVTKNEITLSPKSAGSTTLLIWDNFGEQSYTLKVFSEDISEIKIRVDNLLTKLNLTEVYTQAAEDEGKIMLLGNVKTAKERETIAVALGPLKDKTLDLIQVKEEEAGVEIDVEVLELNKDATKTLGFTMPGSITAGEPATRFSKTIRGAPDAIFHVFDWPRSGEFTATLDFLVQEGKARVLSRPRLTCQSGKEAELLVGGEKPIFTTTVAATTGAQGTAIEYKEFGIKLKIKPTITEEERIKLGLNVEVSEVGTAETIGATTAPTAKAYPLTKRTASTELYLNDGQIMAIGGLIKQKSEEDIRKTPGLGDIPLLGLLFRKKTSKVGGGTGERGDVELLITLTPKIMREKKEVKKVQKEIVPEVAPITIPKNLPESIAGYSQLIQKRILDNLTYPTSAKQAGFQGKVKLSLHLSYTGKLLEAVVKDSSGYELLDNHTVSIARRIPSYPPFPSSIEQDDLWIDIPIHYKLD